MIPIIKSIRAVHACQVINKRTPAPIRIPLKIFLILFVLKLILKRICTRVGRTTIPRIKAAISAKVFVKARGWNSFPSCACIAKTGRKLTIVVEIEVTTAALTSVVASYITFISFFPLIPLFSGISRCLRIFSTSTMPISTITPIAIAIPDKATMFASTPLNLIRMNVIRTPIGSSPATISDALRFITRIIMTMMLIRISCDNADPRVPMVSFIKAVLS